VRVVRERGGLLRAGRDRPLPAEESGGGLRKGQIHPDHYWWLAYSWDNLVFSCQACNRAKRNRFPVIGQRLEPGDPSGAERPLLLDPYGTDDPSGYLWFEDDGTVRPISIVAR
jgi:hypothetical protein